MTVHIGETLTEAREDAVFGWSVTGPGHVIYGWYRWPSYCDWIVPGTLTWENC